MEVKYDNSIWITRLQALFSSRVITIKIMKGDLPSEADGKLMTPTFRDTDLLASFTISTDVNGVGSVPVTLTEFTPTGTGTATWFKIISGTNVACTDLIGTVGSTNKMLIIEKLNLTANEVTFLMAFKIKLGVK